MCREFIILTWYVVRSCCRGQRQLIRLMQMSPPYYHFYHKQKVKNRQLQYATLIPYKKYPLYVYETTSQHMKL